MRIGLVIPHTDTTLEWDLQRTFAGQASVHTARAFLAAVSDEAESRMLDEAVPEAVRLLAAIRPDLLVFGCTSAGALRGAEGDRTLAAALEAEVGCPVVSAFSAVLAALERRVVGPVALFSPYTEGVQATMRRALEAAGISVVEAGTMGLADDSEIGRITPESVHAFVAGAETRIADAAGVFVSCTNLRAAECATPLEAALERPVITSNTAILDAIRRMT